MGAGGVPMGAIPSTSGPAGAYNNVPMMLQQGEFDSVKCRVIRSKICVPIVVFRIDILHEESFKIKRDVGAQCLEADYWGPR